MKILITICTVLCVMMFTNDATAQLKAADVEVEKKSKKLTDEEIREFDQYQFYLDKPAKKIENIKYAKDELPIEGQISKDGKRVIMDGYIKRGRVIAIVHYKDGTKEEVSRSSCVIDPVIPL